ncbi:MAG: hypothetical protein PHS04_14000, partial [Tissierellia bacterium]|nr:hypothetical protein [Tissierellia bacterium]
AGDKGDDWILYWINSLNCSSNTLCMFITTHQQINVGRETTSNVVTGNSLLFPGFRLHQPAQNTRNTG